MPLSYQFVKADTGLPSTLDAIDRLICAEVGVEPSDTKFCDLYMAIMYCGTTISMSGDVTEESVNAYIDNMKKEVGPEACTDEERKIVLRFLCVEYKFDCWRSHR